MLHNGNLVVNSCQNSVLCKESKFQGFQNLRWNPSNPDSNGTKHALRCIQIHMRIGLPWDDIPFNGCQELLAFQMDCWHG